MLVGTGLPHVLRKKRTSHKVCWLVAALDCFCSICCVLNTCVCFCSFDAGLVLCRLGLAAALLLTLDFCAARDVFAGYADMEMNKALAEVAKDEMIL